MQLTSRPKIALIHRQRSIPAAPIAYPTQASYDLGTSVIEDQGFWETHKSKFYIGGGVLMLLGVGFYGWKTLKSK